MKKGFVPLLVAISVLLILLIAGGVYYYSKNIAKAPNNSQSNDTSNATQSPKEVVKLNEKLLIGECQDENSNCTLKLVDSNGAVSSFENKYNLKKVSGHLLSPDGRKLVVPSSEGITIYDLKTGSTQKVNSTKQIKLIRFVGDSFWVEEDGVYKLLNLKGETKFSFNKSDLASHDGVILSSVYSSGNVLAISSRGAEGGSFRTAWQITSDKKVSKLFDLNFNVTGSESVIFADIFNKEEAFLIVTESETYKLTPSNKKTVLVVTGSETGATDNPLLSPDDSQLFYTFHGGSYSQNNTAGLYRLDLASNKKQQLIKGNNYKDADQSFHSYQALSVSPSGDYLAVRDAMVSAIKTTIYTPTVLSLSDNSLQTLGKEAGDIYKAREVFGWIDIK